MRQVARVQRAIAVALLVSLAMQSQPAAARAKKPLGDWKASLVEGEHYLTSKQLRKAEECFQQAYDSARRSKPKSTEGVIICAESLARTLYMEDMIADTIPLYKKALKLERKLYGKKSVKTVPTLIAIGNIYYDEGDYKKALKCFLPALEISKSVDGPNSLAYADLLHRAGKVKAKQGIQKDAETFYLDAVTIIMQQERLPSSALLEATLNDYIDVFFKIDDQGRPLQSAFQVELLKDNIGSLSQKKGTPVSQFHKEVSVRLADKATKEARSDSPETALRGVENAGADSLSPPLPGARSTASDTAFGKYSDFAALEDINQQRVSFYERLIASDIDTLGADHPSVARDLSGLASLYLQQGKFDQAKPLLARALEIYKKSYGANEGPVRQTAFLLELIGEDGTEPGVVDVSYENSLPRIPLQAQKLQVALLLNDLSFMLFCHGRIDTALKVSYWALASTAQTTGKTSLLTAANMTDLGKLLRMKGRATDATPLESSAQAIVRRQLLEARSKLLPR